MKIDFVKYQGTGNDFVLIDNRSGAVRLTGEQVAFLCHRNFGIGGDGLMLLEMADGYDFRMVYYNADGNESTMCGNGGRCITAFAARLGLVTDRATFVAIDGPHHATINDNEVALEMVNVQDIRSYDDHVILNTGSPHYVMRVDDVANTQVFAEGRAIRNQEAFQPKGINVNFMQAIDNGLFIRTYERGVENETLSCGTGVTAGAIASTGAATGSFDIAIRTPGGSLSVSFEKDTATSAKNVWLKGPASFVFEGSIDI